MIAFGKPRSPWGRLVLLFIKLSPFVLLFIATALVLAKSAGLFAEVSCDTSVIIFCGHLAPGNL